MESKILNPFDALQNCFTLKNYLKTDYLIKLKEARKEPTFNKDTFDNDYCKTHNFDKNSLDYLYKNTISLLETSINLYNNYAILSIPKNPLKKDFYIKSQNKIMEFNNIMKLIEQKINESSGKNIESIIMNDDNFSFSNKLADDAIKSITSYLSSSLEIPNKESFGIGSEFKNSDNNLQKRLELHFMLVTGAKAHKNYQEKEQKELQKLMKTSEKAVKISEKMKGIVNNFLLLKYRISGYSKEEAVKLLEKMYINNSLV
jgi:hypothetical protein